MRPVTNGLIVSRRNLLSLLAKLDGAPNGSFCEIVFRHPDSAPFHLYAEEDAVHYAHPSRLGSPPGEMHEDTERQISQAEFRANQTFLARAYITRVAHRDMGYGEAELDRCWLFGHDWKRREWHVLGTCDRCGKKEAGS